MTSVAQVNLTLAWYLPLSVNENLILLLNL